MGPGSKEPVLCRDSEYWQNRLCAFADGIVPNKRLLLEYRSCTGWDQGLPHQGPGWVFAHLTGLENRSGMSLQFGAPAASPGDTMVSSQRAVQLTIDTVTASEVTPTAEVMAPVAIGRAGWGTD